MREHILYTDNYFFDEWAEDNFDYLMENYPEYILEDDEDVEDVSKEELMSRITYEKFDSWYYDDMNMYFENEKYNLDVELPSEIIAFANVGRWNGRYNGYKVLGNNLNEIFNYGEDYNEWKVDQYGRVEQRATHHDGTNYVEYRLLKPTLTDEQKENFFDRLDYEGMDEKTMRRYTVRLGDVIGDVYGWKFCGTRPNGI